MVGSRLMLVLVGILLVAVMVQPVWSQDDDAVDDVDDGDDADDDDTEEEMTMPPPVETTISPSTTTEAAKEGKMEDLVAALADLEDAHMEENSEAAEIVNALLKEVDPELAATIQKEIDEDRAALKEEGDSHRKKRMVIANDHQKWTKGVIPYVFTSQVGSGSGIKQAMAAYERMTCFRFPEFTGDNSQYGVSHKGHLKFITGGGCWSEFGRRNHGQSISCCGGKVCLHELGHAMGAYHDQADPRGRPFVRINLKNVENGKQHNFGYAKMTEFSTGYNSEGVMHYDTWAFSKGGDTITKLDKDIRISQNTFYLFQELSLSHKCGETYCANSIDCVNDGYKTYVDGNCGCVCPYGLDPSTGCATTIKDDNTWATNQKWPKGQYAMPNTQSGCPDGMLEGSKVMPGGGAAPCTDKNARGCPYWGVAGCNSNPTFMNKECPVTCNVCKYLGSWSSPKYDLVSPVPSDASTVETGFCVNDGSVGDDAPRDDGSTFQWPAGSYCLYQVGGSCPAGFSAGSVTFKHGAGASDSGSLPDMESGSDSTKYKFCCRSDGVIGYPVALPVDKPFAIVTNGGCMNVQGANAYEEFTNIRATSASSKGSAPNVEWKNGLYRMKFCYYQPTTKSCGGVIELTADNPEVTIEGNSAPEQECHWIVKSAGENSHVRLNVDSMNIDCSDSLGVRYNRLGNQARQYCGNRLAQSLISIFDSMMITYTTKDQDRGSSFKATLSLINADTMCYNSADNGASYAGTVNVTRYNAPCKPWATTRHCRHNLFQHGDHVDNLESNFCRNPDANDGRAPWCYTDEKTCDRSYCDVCQLEKTYDVSDDCGTIQSLGVCDNEPKKALKLCAETCAANVPTWPAPPLASTLSCGAPTAPSDGVAVDAGKDSYAVGDLVPFACKDQQDIVYSKRCLTDGSWSSLKFVCTACPNGWVSAGGKCFQYFETAGKKSTADAACQAIGATLAIISSKVENDLVKKIGGGWLGGSDAAAEGTWVWSDGTAFKDGYQNWRSGEPDNWYNQQDCVTMNNNGQWLDEHCSRDWQPYTCMKMARTVDDASTCSDFNTYCADNYAADPRVCGVAASSDICKETCGVCSAGRKRAVGSCSVEAAPANAKLVSGGASIAVGGYAEYSCEAGAEEMGGNRFRGCKSDGAMTGVPLDCRKDTLVKTYMKAQGKKWGGKNVRKGYAVTGKIPEFQIKSNGKIVQWNFYSRGGGEGALQVWRCKGSKKCQLIGSNALNTPATPDTYTLYVKPSEQISVKKGDLIGIYMKGNSFGVGWNPCTNENKKLYKKKLLRTKKPMKGKGMEKMKKERSPCRNYQVQAVIKA